MTVFQDVSIVIPNWNGEKLLAEFLPSILQAAKYYQQTYKASVEVIIVDDGSTDNSVNWLKKNYPTEIKLVEQKINSGFSQTANKGFQTAQYPIVFLLNNDIRVEETAIAPLVKHFNDKNLFGVCSKAYRLESDLFDGAGKLGKFRRGHWHIFVNYDIFPTKLSEKSPQFYSFIASGGYSAFDRAKLLKLGGFCSLLNPFYWEDAELCYRAWKRGWTILYEPSSVVYHRSSATIGKKVPAKQVQIISERNRLLMHWINLHDKVWFASHCFWVLLKLFQALIKLDVAYWQSVLSAFKLLPKALKLRKQELLATKTTDREIANIFSTLSKEPWLMVIHNPTDYYNYVKVKQELEQKNQLNSMEQV